MNNNMEYKFLDQINFPDDLRNYKVNDLKSIAKELRHNTPENQYKQMGMDAQSISNKILSLISNEIVHLSNYIKK